MPIGSVLCQPPAWARQPASHWRWRIEASICRKWATRRKERASARRPARSYQHPHRIPATLRELKWIYRFLYAPSHIHRNSTSARVKHRCRLQRVVEAWTNLLRRYLSYNCSWLLQKPNIKTRRTPTEQQPAAANQQQVTNRKNRTTDGEKWQYCWERTFCFYLNRDRERNQTLKMRASFCHLTLHCR